LASVILTCSAFRNKPTSSDQFTPPALTDEKLWTNELQDLVVTSLVVLPEDQQLPQLPDMLCGDIHVRQCARVDKYVAEQAKQKREEDEAKKREEENREADQLANGTAERGPA
jgi:hypothetical protein